jgi:hypothetical protein
MLPSYKESPWLVGVRPDGKMIQIRVLGLEGGYMDYWVPGYPGNRDYQQYLEWAAEGNSPKILFDQEMT